MVAGGTLGQLIMPMTIAVALLVKNKDPFGASIGLWFFGVSIVDISPYMYDALHPVMMLTTGSTGEDGGHDWIYLFSSVGLLSKCHFIAGLIHTLGALVIFLAILWGAMVLRIQYEKIIILNDRIVK